MNVIHQQLFGLLRWAFNGTPFTMEPTAEDWAAIDRLAQEQSVTGVVYSASTSLPANHRPPMELAMYWMSEAETVRGQNKLMNAESARLTKLFADEGRRSAILKGQANALLYPDPLMRLSGDIDIWVEGGRESVVALLRKLGLVDEAPLHEFDRPDRATISYHHVHLPNNDKGVSVEVHFRTTSGNLNPFTNRRMQRWLEEEIMNLKAVSADSLVQTTPPDGTPPNLGGEENTFNVPTIRFALVMQLSHIQHHFFEGGIGLRQVCDYYMLLRHATDDDRREVGSRLKRFGLRYMAGAMMWVLSETLQLEPGQMLCEPDAKRGQQLLDEILAGGNFGKFSDRKKTESDIVFIIRKERMRLQMASINPSEMLWVELNHWREVFSRLPERIRRRRLSLR